MNYLKVLLPTLIITSSALYVTTFNRRENEKTKKADKVVENNFDHLESMPGVYVNNGGICYEYANRRNKDKDKYNTY